MNTEFPRRIPTVNNNSSVPSSSSSTKQTSDDDKSFQATISKLFNETVKLLKGLVEKASDATKPSTSKTSNGKDKSHLDTFVDAVKLTLQKAVNSIKFDSKKDSDETGKGGERSSVGSAFKDGMEWLGDKWADGIKSLQSSVESTASSLGGAISDVFGPGLFGKMIGNIFTKVITFGVNKILLGTIMANLPMTLVVGAILAAVGLCVYYSKEIWEGIKWLGWSIDQGLDAFASIWRKSKYEEARNNLAKEAGLKKEDILRYYGDTVRGRNQAYEDWKRAENDEEFKNELIRSIQESQREFSNMMNSRSLITDPNLMPATDRTIYQIQNITNNGSSMPTSELPQSYDFPVDTVRGQSLIPVVNNSSNVTQAFIDPIGNNTAKVYPSSSIPSEFRMNSPLNSLGV